MNNFSLARTFLKFLLSLWVFCPGALPQGAARPHASATNPLGANGNAIRSSLLTSLEELRELHGFPGATAATVLPDGTVIAVAVGKSDLEAGTPMKPSDLMLAGSIGKTFFASIMMELIHERKFNLDQKIQTWIGDEPWFNRIPNATDITLRMLMNHTSGIPEHAESPQFVAALLKDPDKSWTPLEILSFTFDKPAKFPAGTDWSYADTNYILMGYIAEKVTGKDLYDLVRRQILIPLALSDTIPSTSRTLPGLIPGYSMTNSPFQFEGRTIKDGKFVMNPQMEWTGGGFVSTSSDLARWSKDIYEGKAFDKSMLPVMLASVPAKTGKGDEYGLGVQVRHTEFGVSYGHGGWFPGYLSEMEYFPEKKTSIAIQVNTDDFTKMKSSTHLYILEMAKALFQAPGAAAQAHNSAEGRKPTLLVLSKPAAKLLIVDPAARKVIGEVSTGTAPHELAVSEDGKLAFVGNYGAQVPGDSLSVIDLAARKEIRRHNLGALRRPHGMVQSHGKIYFTAEMNKVVARYDPASDSVDWIEGTGQDTTHMLVITSDQKKIFTSNIQSDSVSVLEASGTGQNWHVTQISVGNRPEGIDISPDGKEVWTAHSVDGGVSIIDAESKKIKETLPSLTRHSNRLKFTPDGKLVLISDPESNQVLAVDSDSRKLLKKIPVCAQPLGIQMTPDNKQAYVACAKDGQVGIIDLSTLSQTGTIDVGPGPDGLAWVQ